MYYNYPTCKLALALRLFACERVWFLVLHRNLINCMLWFNKYKVHNWRAEMTINSSLTFKRHTLTFDKFE